MFAVQTSGMHCACVHTKRRHALRMRSHELESDARFCCKSPPPPPKNKISDEKERLRGKNWRARRQLLVCGPKAIFTLFFPLLLPVHCTCAGEKEVKRAQDSNALRMGALVEGFERSQTLRVSSPFLSKFLKKALLYRCEKAKIQTCTATESKQIPRLVMAKLCLPASCC